MGGTYSGEWANEGGAVDDCGGVVMAQKQSPSQVSCGEVVAVSAMLANDANQVTMQLILNAHNTAIFVYLEGIGKSHD